MCEYPQPPSLHTPKKRMLVSDMKEFLLKREVFKNPAGYQLRAHVLCRQEVCFIMKQNLIILILCSGLFSQTQRSLFISKSNLYDDQRLRIESTKMDFIIFNF